MTVVDFTARDNEDWSDISLRVLGTKFFWHYFTKRYDRIPVPHKKYSVSTNALSTYFHNLQPREPDTCPCCGGFL